MISLFPSRSLSPVKWMPWNFQCEDLVRLTDESDIGLSGFALWTMMSEALSLSVSVSDV